MAVSALSCELRLVVEALGAGRDAVASRHNQPKRRLTAAVLQRDRKAHLCPHAVLSLLNGPGSLTIILTRFPATSSLSRAFEQRRSARKRTTLRGRLAGIAIRLVRWFMRRARRMRVLGGDRGPVIAESEELATDSDPRAQLVLVDWWARHDQWERWDRVDVTDGGRAGGGGVRVGMSLLAGRRQAPDLHGRCRQSHPRWKAKRRSRRR